MARELREEERLGLNHCTIDDLESLEDVGRHLAERIIDHRKANRHF